MNPKSGWNSALMCLGALAGIGMPARAVDDVIPNGVIIQGGVTIEVPDTPNVLLKQAGGIAPARTWKISGNQSDFRVADVTGNKTPFVISVGAPTGSLFMNPAGNLALGTSSPLAAFHVNKLAQTGVAETLARFNVSDDTIGKLVISNSSSTAALFIPKIQGVSASTNAALITEGLITTDTGTNPVLVYNAALAAGGPVVNRTLVQYRNNNAVKVSMLANGHITASAFDVVSSRELKDQIVNLDSRRASDALQQLTPVEFVYKDDPAAEKQVGFIAEDVPELVSNATRKSVPVMDVVALVTKVVKDQQQTINEQKKSLDEQKKTIDELVKRLGALESQMQDKK